MGRKINQLTTVSEPIEAKSLLEFFALMLGSVALMLTAPIILGVAGVVPGVFLGRLAAMIVGAPSIDHEIWGNVGALIGAFATNAIGLISIILDEDWGQRIENWGQKLQALSLFQSARSTKFFRLIIEPILIDIEEEYQAAIDEGDGWRDRDDSWTARSGGLWSPDSGSSWKACLVLADGFWSLATALVAYGTYFAIDKVFQIAGFKR